MSKHDVPTTLTVPIEATGRPILLLHAAHDLIAVKKEVRSGAGPDEIVIARGALGDLYEPDLSITPSDTTCVDVQISVHSSALRKTIEGAEGIKLVDYEITRDDHSLEGADDDTVEIEFGPLSKSGSDVLLEMPDEPAYTGKPELTEGVSPTEIEWFDVDPDVADQTFARVQSELETARENGVDVTEIILGIPQYKALLVYANRRRETTVRPSAMLGIGVLTVPNPQIHVPRDNIRSLHEYESSSL
jgi:hypothetical protein